VIVIARLTLEKTPHHSWLERIGYTDPERNGKDCIKAWDARGNCF